MPTLPSPKSTNIFNYPAMTQFDQPNIPFALARTGCTDTTVQMIIQYYKDKTISLTNIRRASGVPIDGVHGLTIEGVLAALEEYGITWYRYAKNVSATTVLQKAHIGPTIAGVGYAKYPNKLHGGCSQTNTAQLGGRVDCDFGGSHAVLAIGSTPVRNKLGIIVRYDAFVRDPDHHLLSVPKYDRIKGAQLTATMKALITDTAWDTTFCIYPLRKKVI